jgi:low temperature requirement protein LtrA
VKADIRTSQAAGEPEHEGRRVTWLELFFDLVFVAAVTQVAEPLRHHYTWHELARLAPLFLLICWAWKGQAVYATRFGVDAPAQRALTLVQMFTIAIMAANATDALASESTAGFVAAYAALRLMLVGQYAAARRAPRGRPLITRYVAGHGVAAAIWLWSALVPAPWRFVLWAVAAFIDLTTPWFAVAHTVDLPPDKAHLPERLGLFMLILLGDAVIAVMQGMESQETWSPGAAVSAFLGMAILFTLWWWYFDGAVAASEQVVRHRRDAVRLHVWSYAHLPLYLGVIVLGVGLRRSVTAAARTALPLEEALIVAAAAALVMAALAVVATRAGDRRQATGVDWTRHLVLAAVTPPAGALSGLHSPEALSATLAALMLAQLGLSLATRRPRAAAVPLMGLEDGKESLT